MINSRIICKILGSLLYQEAVSMLVCMGVALWFGEDDILLFASSALITIFAGVLLRFFGRDADNGFSRRDSYLLVTLVWIVYSLFATLPFILGGYIHSFTDAYFEAMSGFTTTGATIIDDVDALPHGILFWRSLTQWVGGLGIVFTVIAFIPSMAGSSGSIRVFGAESTGPFKSKLQPRLSTSVRFIWLVYLVISVWCFASYMVFGMNWFEAANYTMTTVATGGMGVNNSSTEHFQSPALEYVTTFFCFLSGTNFTLLYLTMFKGKLKSLFRDTEFRFYVFMVAACTAFIMVELIVENHYAVEHAFRSAIFQVVSFITTTGLFNDDAAAWPHVTWIVLTVCMFFGACSGSTTGGLKCVRCVMIFKVLRNELMQRIHPSAVLPLKIAEYNVPNRQRVSLMAFVSAYLMLFFLFAFVIVAAGVDNTNAITICFSCLSNVGPTLGTEIGPTMSWSQLPSFIKWLCSFMMLVGRLEIFTVMLVLTPAFWNKNK